MSHKKAKRQRKINVAAKNFASFNSMNNELNAITTGEPITESVIAECEGIFGRQHIEELQTMNAIYNRKRNSFVIKDKLGIFEVTPTEMKLHSVI